MVVKMMKWRPWPPLLSKKFDVKLTVTKLLSSDLLRQSSSKLTVEIKWKGPKSTLASLRRYSVARNFTRYSQIQLDDVGDYVVYWDEEFHNLCNLNALKDNAFLPWEIAFNLFDVMSLSLFPSFHALSFIF